MSEKKRISIEQQTKILRVKVKTPYMDLNHRVLVILDIHIQEQTLKWLG